VAIGDFFLVFSGVIMDLGNFTTIFGMAEFICAYTCLIIAYHKNFKIEAKEILAGIPILGVYLYIFHSLNTYLELPMIIATIVFGLVICYMTWCAVCCVFRKFYAPKAAFIIAISGIFMFICDMGVAYSLFDPAYSIEFTSWIKNIVWGVYVPG